MSETESSYRDHELKSKSVSGLGFAVITLSDTRTEETDKSGRLIHATAEAAGHHVSRYAIVTDDVERIAVELTAALADPTVDVVITNGGTGISLRDSAFEVISSKLDKRLDGFGELFRMLSYAEIGAAALLSRAIGGVANGKIVFALPGSTNAVRLGIETLILPQVGHLHQELHKHDA
ncbi:MAG: molybdenum cofactor biosynthesis protein MoaB [Planctomycetota bacterium]|nr:molybdenum cofactor biosynthesis protein MoaB [Planctomycetota bacterium]